MLSILSFFFMRGREVVETEASTKEEVDCDTWENYGGGGERNASTVSSDPREAGANPRPLIKEGGGLTKKYN